MAGSRVKFYSREDLSAGWNLERAERILLEQETHSAGGDYSVNDVIELYNITRFLLDEKCSLTAWTEEHRRLLEERARRLLSVIGRFFNAVTEQNFSGLYQELERKYREDYFTLLTKYKATSRISQEAFARLLAMDNVPLPPILAVKEVVRIYGAPLRDRMLVDSTSAELLLDKYEVRQRPGGKNMYIPAELSLEDKERIIAGYVAGPQPNLNFLRLIANVQGSKDTLVLSLQTRLAAKKRAEQKEDELFSENSSVEYAVRVVFSEEQKEAVVVECEGFDVSASYSRRWLYEHLDYPTVLNNFIHLFGYTDLCMRCELFCRVHQMGVVERELFMRGRSGYPVGTAFDMQNLLSFMQLQAYRWLLIEKGIRLEAAVEWFFREYLREEFQVEGCSIAMPSEHTSCLEKCTLVMPAMEHALKQFALYVRTGSIDHELLQIQSEQLIYSTIPSLCPRKYVYGTGNEYAQAAFLLFSDQSGLGYFGREDRTYDSYDELLQKEAVYFEDYNDWEKREVQWLIDHGYLTMEGSGGIGVASPHRMRVLRELYFKDVLTYWKYPAEIRREIDELEQKGIVELESTLLSRPEADYFDYFLNKARYNNGLDLRNRYAHMQPYAAAGEDKLHEQNYLIFMRLFILAIIKINDDFCTFDSIQKWKETEK